MKIISIIKKNIYYLSCLLLLFSVGISVLPAQAKTKTYSSTTSITKLNTIIEENEKEINLLIEKQKQSSAECSEAINHALSSGLLVNEKDLDTLENLSARLESRTEKLKAAKTEQQEIQSKLDNNPKMKTRKYRKNKCKIITLQNRRFKLISQINKDTKKIMKLCSSDKENTD